MDDRVPSDRFDKAIFLAMSIILILLIVFMAFNLTVQYYNYGDGIKLTTEGTESLNHAALLSYSRAWDFAVVRTSALFLSFLLMFTGAIYVLRVGKTDFRLSVEKGDLKGNLITSSPGLVMVTLGVLLVACVLISRNSVEYKNLMTIPRNQDVAGEKRKELAPDPFNTQTHNS